MGEVRMEKIVKVAVVGLNFGKEFVPLYQNHPNAEVVAICQRSKEHLNEVGEEFKIRRCYTNYEDVLKDEEIDAIHVATPIADHAQMTMESLNAGKHTACAVPMGTTKEECLEIVKTRKKTKKVYFMLETHIFTRAYFYVKELIEKGEIGKIQFMRGTHTQNMSLPGWPEYWYGFPPMLYGTHAIAPALSLAKDTAESVVCYGSGRQRDEYIDFYNSPFAAETAIFKLRESDIAFEVTRWCFDTVRQCRESFDIYGSKMSFEWEQIEHEGFALFSNFEDVERVHPPDYSHLLPQELAPQTTGVHDESQVSFIQGAGHGGSHPHVANEFIEAIIEDRTSLCDAVPSANWTIPGICAHESAMNDGVKVNIPLAK
jgi:predicted dehydrogenase